MSVVLLHALPLDERMWEPQRAALADHDVFAPNLYRLGSSMDAWARAVLDHVDDELLVVGASMGGYCGLALARLAPERIRALVLAGSRPDADTDERRRSRDETIALIEREGAAGLWESLRSRLFPPDAPAETVERARVLALEQDTRGLVAALQAIRDRPDSTDAARALGARLLVVVGDRDPFVPVEDARRLVGDRVHVLSGAGHLASLERPGEFNAVLTDFLAEWT